MDRQQVAADALAQRLAMTISLSTVPMVEEWMDDELSRWLESVPAPMEMAADAMCRLRVEYDADLERLTWSAIGDPSAFIPKLARYLDRNGVQPGDLGRINAIGEAFEPTAVGSWIRVLPGKTETGWCFEHEFERQALRDILEPSAAVADAFDHFAEVGISAISGLSGTLATPSLSFQCNLEQNWSEVFRALVTSIGGHGRADDLVGFFERCPVQSPRAEITTTAGAIRRVALIASELLVDDLAALCHATQFDASDRLDALHRALGATRSVELIAGIDGSRPFVAARVVPGAESPSSAAAN